MTTLAVPPQRQAVGVKMRVGPRGHERIDEAIVLVLRRVREQVVDAVQPGAQAIS